MPRIVISSISLTKDCIFFFRDDSGEAFILCKCLLQLCWQQEQHPPQSLWPMGVIKQSSTLAFIEPMNLEAHVAVGSWSNRS